LCSNVILILLVAAVGIPLPANFSKQSGPQIDDNEHLSSGNSEIHPVEASKQLVPEGGAGARTAFLTGIICCPQGYFISAAHFEQDQG
jgi:hypothetical protein